MTKRGQTEQDDVVVVTKTNDDRIGRSVGCYFRFSNESRKEKKRIGEWISQNDFLQEIDKEKGQKINLFFLIKFIFIKRVKKDF